MMVILGLLFAAAEAAKTTALVKLSERELTAISTRCHSPRRWLRYDASGALHIQPSPTAAYSKVDCVLTALKRSGAEPMGYVGNMYSQ